MDMMQLKQLSVDGKTVSSEHTKENLKPPSDKYNRLIMTLATNNPLWRFVVTSVRGWEHKVQTIRVYQYGEELGFIEWDYFRGDWGFEIGNDRIDKARERARAYRTHDEKKALTCIKKTFSPKNVGERVEEAVEKAEKLIGNQVWQKNRVFHDTKQAVDRRALEFVALRQDQFKAYMEVTNQMHILEKHQEAELEMKTLQDMQNEFGNCTIVIQVDEGYIVRSKDDVQMMNNTTLPEHMKAKLGMLKLVDDEHFIANIGGKVKADVFVLTPEGESK